MDIMMIPISKITKIISGINIFLKIGCFFIFYLNNLVLQLIHFSEQGIIPEIKIFLCVEFPYGILIT